MPFETTFWSVLESARCSSEETAREIVRRYQPPVLEYVRRRGFSPEDAEDVTQEVLMELCKPGFLASADRAKGRFRSLVLSVARHKMSSHLRREYAVKRGGGTTWVSIHEPAGEDLVLGDMLAAAPESGDAEFDRLWVLNIVRRAAARLREESPHLGEAFSLFYDEGLPYSEIETRMGKGKFDVTNYLNEARRRIRKYVRQIIEEYVSSYEEFESELRELMEHL